MSRVTKDRNVDPARLTGLLSAILQQAGCEAEEAFVVADHLVEASLRGHHSHGVIRVERYCAWLASGTILPNRELRVIADAGTMLHLDGQSGMGQRLARDATAMGIERARAQGSALVALRRAGHVGRLGAYAEQAADAGLVSVHFVNVAGSSLVAPFGAAQRGIGTNPVAIGVPNPEGDDFVLDFATSMVAEGKALVAARGGKPLPDDALIDGAGRRTSDPRVLYGDSIETDVPNPRDGPGALRTMGQHKGSGLALACELLAGALTGNGTNASGDGPFGNGLLSILIDPARLDDGGGFGQEVSDYIRFVQTAAPEEGVDRVLIPGDPERERRRAGLADGLLVPAAVLDGIVALAKRLGIEPDRLERAAS